LENSTEGVHQDTKVPEHLRDSSLNNITAHIQENKANVTKNMSQEHKQRLSDALGENRNSKVVDSK
jgi:hypothetical protein